MARKPRIEIENGLYHVIVRGNQKQEIFRNDDDYGRYLKLLLAYKQKFFFLIHAYVLMSNHVHLLIETGRFPLSKIMQGINQSYTAYFNRKHDTVGHLFQGRYKAILCDHDEYLLEIVKYIHLNPVRAGMVSGPEAYRWSSHQSYLQKNEKTGIADTGHVLRMFADEGKTARKLYRNYMGEPVSLTREDVYCAVDQRLLGDERFVEEVRKKSTASIHKTRKKRGYTLAEIAAAVEKTHGVSLEHLRGRSKSKNLSLGKKLMSLVAAEYGYKGKEIAEFIHKDPVIVTRHLKEKESLRAETERLINALLRMNRRSNVNSQV